jgi:hypothetical protein
MREEPRDENGTLTQDAIVALAWALDPVGNRLDLSRDADDTLTVEATRALRWAIGITADMTAELEPEP